MAIAFALTIGALLLAVVSLVLISADNRYSTRGHTWRLNCAWAFIGVWVFLGTIANIVALEASNQASVNVFPGDLAEWQEALATTLLTALVLALTGAAYSTHRIMNGAMNVLLARITFAAGGWLVTGLLFWLTTGDKISETESFGNLPAFVGSAGAFAIIGAVYLLVISLARIGLERQIENIGVDGRRWLYENTNAQEILRECTMLQAGKKNRNFELIEAIAAATEDLKLNPDMPISEVYAVIDSFDDAEAMDMKVRIQRQQRTSNRWFDFLKSPNKSS